MMGQHVGRMTSRNDPEATREMLLCGGSLTDTKSIGVDEGVHGLVRRQRGAKVTEFG